MYPNPTGWCSRVTHHRSMPTTAWIPYNREQVCSSPIYSHTKKREETNQKNNFSFSSFFLFPHSFISHYTFTRQLASMAQPHATSTQNLGCAIGTMYTTIPFNIKFVVNTITYICLFTLSPAPHPCAEPL